jgi:phospholipase D1/2
LDPQPDDNHLTRRSGHIWQLAALLGLLTLAAAWQWAPFNRWLDLQVLAEWQRSVQSHPLAPFMVVAAYVLGGAVLFPVTLLTAATIVTFGPFTGNLYGLGGWVVSASLGFCVGRHLQLDWFWRLLGDRFERLHRGAEKKGLIAVLGLRLVPVAPFTIVNLFIGASRIGFGDFILGSILGRIPGILTFTLVAMQLGNLSQAVSLVRFLALAVALALVLLAERWIVRQLIRAERKSYSPEN